ncbi:MAG TPA: glucose-6-phosphate dehydrogenase, partial [Candidatus Sulfotelmatobacter sp.]|nr:glucose-6-phosphate dehydrogenase [Candidatus Sulfotelmatobacter sp.]
NKHFKIKDKSFRIRLMNFESFESYVTQPFIMVIFGATGDLAHNKLIPSLFSLFKKHMITSEFLIIGFSRRDVTDEEYRNFFPQLSKEKEWKYFALHLRYQNGDFIEEKGYLELIDKLNSFDKQMGACITRFFYLATPPVNYTPILNYLHSTKLSEGCGQGSNKWTRIVIEKPFGKDLKTAIALDKKLSQIFEEKQIFRVDHYLGKETVQNMIAFRFANGIFEPVWNNNYIENVQITFFETKGVGTRGKFFEGVGILRDVGQNHLMQLLATVAMERPKRFEKESIRDERAKVIKAIRNILPSKVFKFVVKGQYKTYKKEIDVSKNSRTETFAAVKLFVNTKRFKNVPFYLRIGKKMHKESVYISIVFKQTNHELFKEYQTLEKQNVLTIRIQPNEGISLKLIAKKPGAKLSLNEVNMKFNYSEEFGEKVFDAYEKILLDIFAGDQMLFNRSDELAYSWKFITNILKGWEKHKTKMLVYNDNSQGPKEAIDLIEKDKRKWMD